MMPVDVFIKTQKVSSYEPERKSYRYYGHQSNPLFTIDTQDIINEETEICPCCVDKLEDDRNKKMFILKKK